MCRGEGWDFLWGDKARVFIIILQPSTLIAINACELALNFILKIPLIASKMQELIVVDSIFKSFYKVGCAYLFPGLLLRKLLVTIFGLLNFVWSVYTFYYTLLVSVPTLLGCINCPCLLVMCFFNQLKDCWLFLFSMLLQILTLGENGDLENVKSVCISTCFYYYINNNCCLLSLRSIED